MTNPSFSSDSTERAVAAWTPPVLFNEGERQMLYILWLVITPTLMAAANWYGFWWGVDWAMAEADKEMGG